MSRARKVKITKKKTKNRKYTTISKVIYDLENITDTQKIVFAMIHNLPSEWNHIKTFTIAKDMNIHVSTVRAAIQELVNQGYLVQEYYNARKRRFKSTIDKEKTKDQYAIIASDILGSDLSSTYKITAGIIVASSRGKDNYLGGFNFRQGAKELAVILKLSLSSVYRHISELVNVFLIKRHEESFWLLQPLDEHSLSFNRKQKLKYNRLLSEGKIKQIEIAEEDIILTDVQDAVLNKYGATFQLNQA